MMECDISVEKEFGAKKVCPAFLKQYLHVLASALRKRDVCSLTLPLFPSYLSPPQKRIYGCDWQSPTFMDCFSLTVRITVIKKDRQVLFYLPWPTDGGTNPSGLTWTIIMPVFAPLVCRVCRHADICLVALILLQALCSSCLEDAGNKVLILTPHVNRHLDL